ncbi:WD40-repeat-containing domain protein [Baffinella frigidus]|nr:WD40-repeat-containing domain protein [Cryptophyta sp. CCMP2293]
MVLWQVCSLTWQVCTLTGHSGEINSVSFFPDGKRVVSGSSDLLVKIWDVATGAEIWSSARHDCSDKCLCAMEINVYGDDAVTVHPECPVTGHAGEVFSVVVSPDGTRVVSGSTDSLVKCWNAETGTEAEGS